MDKFKIVVIGTINKDTIIFPNGKKTESFGGILYNILALSYLGREEVKIYPVCNLGYDVYDQVISQLENCNNVELDGIKKVDSKNNHAFLSINKKNQREETLKNRVPPLSFSHIKPFLGADVILVNFISGLDLSLLALKKIRKNTDALIFMDVHSLTLGVDDSGKRFFDAPENWREWIKQADLVQMNLPELKELSQRNLKSHKEIAEFGKYILNSGLKAVLVTLGEEGSLMISDDKVRKFKGSRVQRFKDATGCGDVFSAGFLICYVHTKDLIKSVNFANYVAGEKCKVSGVEGMKKLFDRIAIAV
ncbi:MAG: carbohydrate kinase family protein [candidate division Zixibacteria bacterium]|nr:carbohydrate kinase family protein [candidate division Zixibacteria bacterium]